MLLFTLSFLFCISVITYFSLAYYFYFFGFLILLLKPWIPSLKHLTPLLILIFISCLLQNLRDKNPVQFNKVVSARGIITSIPEIINNKAHFDFFILKINNQPITPFTAKLSWHFPPEDLHIGQEWKIQTKLNGIHSRANPGCFNYQQWTKAHGIATTGFVLPAADYELVGNHSIRFFLGRLREKMATQITSFTHSDYSPFLTALSVGLRQGVTPTQWQILQATGTNHLIAIAGLHIGFLTSFVIALTHFIWKKNKKLILLFPTPLACALAALISASFYSALAGFSLPTVRALMMLNFFLISILCRRHITLTTSFSLALILILLIQPTVTLEDSFWLSFGSVALILYCTQGRMITSTFWQHIKLQWILTIGLIPFTLLFYQQISGVSFICNAIAIPCIGWIILPLCLTGVLFLKIKWISASLFCVANKAFEYLWLFLTKMASVSLFQFHIAISHPLLILPTFIGMVLLLAPTRFPAKWLCIFWWLPLFIHFSELKNGEIKIFVFDVNKGQSIFIRTAHHTLLFDAGDKEGEQDTGKEIIIPFFRIEKVESLDAMIISGNDKKLFGGAQCVLNEYPTKQIITAEPDLFEKSPIQSCQTTSSWEWEQIRFKLLPTLKSCSLLITTPEQKNILITSHLSADEFKQLLAMPLPTSFTLITPHYGSTTKSLIHFIKQTSVERLILSGKPITHSSIPVFDTEENGMMTVKINSSNDLTLTPFRR